MTRGTVISLTAAQRRDRMLYLAGELTIDKIAGVAPFNPKDVDGYADVNGSFITPLKCPTIFYRLNGDHDGFPPYNGGKDPTAPDPADRWRKPQSTFINRTCDCIGGMSWAGGFDRYQQERFAHLYNGWINTDSMRMDARGKQRCFMRLEKPVAGCFVVFESDRAHKVHSHSVGHIGGVTEVPAEFAPTEREWWQALGVVDVAGRIGRANKRGNGLTWYKTDAYFIVPTMAP